MKKHVTSAEIPCPACELPTNRRLNYFTGQFLTEWDFRDEQTYHRGKRLQHNRLLHGFGTVCGLKVVPHERAECQDRFVKIQSGLALDRCGREIWVPEAVYVDLNKHLAEQLTEGKGQLPGKHLLISLCYEECGTELVPALFDECSCGETRCEPNRIRESYVVKVVPVSDVQKPEPAERITTEYGVWECEELYEHMLEPCPEPHPPECVPLAVIQDYVPGQKITQRMIDNWTHRPLLPSTHLLDQLIRCILAKKKLTWIENIGWGQGEEYTWENFLRYFVGDEKSPRSFEVEFSGPVYLTEDIKAESFSPHIFQAVIVRNVDDLSNGHPFEVIPARAWQSDDRTRIFLQIDPSYAEEHLSGIAFDLYLTVRCNLIVDEKGIPVDGDLLARRQIDGTYEGTAPTGDGIPGGTFESWIRVRPGRQERPYQG
jgi:hypothetical protein